VCPVVIQAIRLIGHQPPSIEPGSAFARGRVVHLAHLGHLGDVGTAIWVVLKGGYTCSELVITAEFETEGEGTQWHWLTCG
jgi:hypothetical protein